MNSNLRDYLFFLQARVDLHGLLVALLLEGVLEVVLGDLVLLQEEVQQRLREDPQEREGQVQEGHRRFEFARENRQTGREG